MIDTFYLVTISAFLSSISYAVYGKYYDKVVKNLAEQSSLIPSTLLYGLASIILLLITIIAYLVFGGNFELIQTLNLWGTTVKNRDDIFYFMLFLLGSSVLLYAVHVLYEAKSRRDYSVATYGTIVQLNIIFIVLMNSLVKQVIPSFLSIIGVIVILIASIGAFINAYGSPNYSNTTIIKNAFIATATLGIALFIDGEIVNNFIFNNRITTNRISLFLFYEMLTFSIPTLLTFFVLTTKRTNNDLNNLKNIYNANTKDAWLSALFSVGQFTFAVISLSFSNYRTLAISILGLAPLFSVLIDTNSFTTKTKQQKQFDLLFSIIALIGIILTATCN